MILRKINILSFIFFITINAFGQQKPVWDYKGKDVRVRAASDYQVSHFSQVSKLGPNKILFGVYFPEDISSATRTVLYLDISKKDLNFGIEHFVDSILKVNIFEKYTQYMRLSDEDFRSLNIETNIWNGKLKIINTEVLYDIRNKYDAEYLIVLMGGGFGDFLRGTQLPFGSQGLFKYGKEIFIYAGHIIAIFDLETGKIVKKGFMVQVSADFSNLKSSKHFEKYDTSETKMLELEIKQRIENNIIETIKILGIK